MPLFSLLLFSDAARPASNWPVTGLISRGDCCEPGPELLDMLPVEESLLLSDLGTGLRVTEEEEEEEGGGMRPA